MTGAVRDHANQARFIPCTALFLFQSDGAQQLGQKSKGVTATDLTYCGGSAM